MRLEVENFEFNEKKINQNERRIYVCESGSVRIEEKHFRQTLSPEEFIVLLRQIFHGTNGKQSNSPAIL